MLIQRAEIHGYGLGDLRIEGERIAEIGDLAPRPGERTMAAQGFLLLPGLHDHHIHMAGLAAAQTSVLCGPPHVNNRDELARALALPGQGWIRGTGYDESVMRGLPDASSLDQLQSSRPLRIQHRTGRMWLFNSAALDILLSTGEDASRNLECRNGRFTGRLFDDDAWLRKALGSIPPDFTAVSASLAARGVTGITDMSPANGPDIAAHFTRQRASGALTQSVVLCGSLDLAHASPDGWQLGAAKLHLHESALPEFDHALSFVRSAHAQGRPVAVHCVTEVELVFTIALFEAAGVVSGDRVEHVSIASPDLVARMADLHLHACVQPHFIAERGDRYLSDVEQRHHPDLYRLRSLSNAGIALAGGSDAPYGGSNPWNAMAAAVSRKTIGGRIIGPDEALEPEGALNFYLANPLDLGHTRRLQVGAPADLCLIDRLWSEARCDLAAVNVLATVASGQLIHDCIDEAPVQSLPR